jgi:tetratricopeptide (TPR) repeat protein
MHPAPAFDQLIADGLAASREGRVTAALDLFTRASALVPGSGIPHFLIASEQAAAGDLESAECGFAHAVLLAPDFVLARYHLGLLQFSAHRAAVALVTWQPLLSLPEADALPHFVRGFVALARDALDEALAHYRAGLSCESGNPALAADIRELIVEVERIASERDGDDAPVLMAECPRQLH